MVDLKVGDIIKRRASCNRGVTWKRTVDRYLLSAHKHKECNRFIVSGISGSGNYISVRSVDINNNIIGEELCYYDMAKFELIKMKELSYEQYNKLKKPLYL